MDIKIRTICIALFMVVFFGACDKDGGDQALFLGNYAFSYPPSPEEVGVEYNSISTIRGVVQNGHSMLLEQGVTVQLLYDGNQIDSVVTDESGAYQFSSLNNGRYELVFSKNGFLESSYYYDVLQSGDYRLETIRLISSRNINEIVNISGDVIDGDLGKTLKNFSIKIRKNFNNKISDPLFEDASGAQEYSFSIPKGYYTIEVSKDGYENAYYNITVASNMKKKLVLIEEVLSNEMKIVLTWNKNPQDLDLHMSRIDNGNTLYHVFYNNNTITKYHDSIQLNFDTISGYGPEVLTCKIDMTGVYKLYVHNYSERETSVSDTLALSGAKVTIYTAQSSIEFYVPYSNGTVWKVLEINHGKIRECLNECTLYESSAENTAIFGGFSPPNPRSQTKNKGIDIFKNLPLKD